MGSPLRVFLDEPLMAGKLLQLDQDEEHHLKRVLRAKNGDSIQTVNGRGDLAEATLEESTYIESVTHSPKGKERWLIQAMLEVNHLELAIEKGTEIGITHFHIFPAKKSKLVSLSKNKEERLHKITISALKQCQRLYLPKITFYPSKEALPQLPTHSYLADITGKPLTPSGEDSAIIVGPESGFTKEEVAFWLNQKKAQPVKLGENVLRAETASILASAFLFTLTS